jgi:hypothetical protein
LPCLDVEARLVCLYDDRHVTLDAGDSRRAFHRKGFTHRRGTYLSGLHSQILHARTSRQGHVNGERRSGGKHKTDGQTAPGGTGLCVCTHECTRRCMSVPPQSSHLLDHVAHLHTNLHDVSYDAVWYRHLVADDGAGDEPPQRPRGVRGARRPI